ncbi:MAG: extracellular solute-binding protein, partial [Candidatus Scatosoma sp.]
MKSVKKTAVLALAAAMTLSGMAGCGGGSSKSDPSTLKVMVTDAGFGLEWMYAIAEEFEALNNVTVKITPTAESTNELIKVEQELNDSDVFFCATANAVWDTMRKRKMLNINDVWNSKASDEEELTIKEKALAEYSDAYCMIDGNYYSLPFILEVGTLGYNANTLNGVFGEGNWDLPRTTMELTAMCEAIREAGCYGFSWSSGQNACYWGLVMDVWEAQYDGSEVYNHAKQAEYYDVASNSWKIDPTGETVVGRLGKLRACEAAYDYVNKCTFKTDGSYEGGYSHQYCTSMTFIQSQTAFAGGGYGEADKRKVAFVPTGSWLFEESKAQIEQYALGQVGCMNAPIISSLSEQLSYYGDRDEFSKLSETEQEKLDKALVAIIDYVDGVTNDKPTTVEGFTITDADIERVREARGVATLKDQAHAFIPATAGNPDLAKKFLRFFCSDYAGSIYSSVTHGYSPFYITVEETNKFLN